MSSEPSPRKHERSLWTKLPPQTLPRERFPGADVLAGEISRAHKNHPRHALFLGAGASVTSGIPDARNLIDGWKRDFFRDRFRNEAIDALSKQDFERKYNEWCQPPEPKPREPSEPSKYEKEAREWEQLHERHPSEYAFLFGFVARRPFARQEIIEQLVECKEPGPGYIYLASLVKDGWFRTILTTNFDDLIHDALFRYADLKPAVCAFDSQLTSIHPGSARPTIVKLHGDFMYNNMRNVGPEVQRLSQNMREKLLQTCKSNGLIVLGYGGGDDSVMMPLQTMLHEELYLEDGLHWCLYCPRNARNVTIPGEVWRLYESHPDRVILYCTHGFDEVMERMYITAKCSPPKDLEHPRERTLYQRINKALTDNDQRYRVSQHFNELLGGFLKADQQIRYWYTRELDLADYYFSSALWATEIERFKEAQQGLDLVIEKCAAVLDDERPENEPPSDTPAKVRARRRRSGALSHKVHCILADRKVPKKPIPHNLKNLPEEIVSQILRLAADGLNDVKEGLRTAGPLPAAESDKQLRALTYNGLVTLGYLRLACGQTLDAEAWDSHMKSLRGVTMCRLGCCAIGNKAAQNRINRHVLT